MDLNNQKMKNHTQSPNQYNLTYRFTPYPHSNYFRHTVPLNFLHVSKTQHWSTILSNSLSIPVVLLTFSFLTLSIRDSSTRLIKHFTSRTSTLIFSVLLLPNAAASYNAVGIIILSYRHLFAFIPNAMLLSPVSSAPHAFYTPHSFCVTYPFHIHYPLPLASTGT